MRELIDGVNAIREALKAGRRIYKITMTGGKNKEGVKEILALARQKNVLVEETDQTTIDRLVHGPHQGIVAEAEPFRYCEIEDILLAAEKKEEPPLILILDGIEDPQNLGAIIRTAECLGAHGVILSKHGACEITSAVGRASAGAVEHMRVVRAGNLVQSMKSLKQKGVWIVGAEADGDTSLVDFRFPEPVALVIGGEGKGIRHLVRENCDFVIRIPMKGRVNSLNASVSGALILYEAVRQREAAKPV